MVSGERVPFLSTPKRGLYCLLFLHGVGTLALQVINKKEGDSVLFLLKNFKGERQYEIVRWNWNGKSIAEKSNGLEPKYRNIMFKGRLKMNSSNFSLTVENLELRDTGIVSVVLELITGKQEPTQFFTLQVYKSITEAKIDSNSTILKNGSCSVWLACSSPGHANVSYTWRIKNQTHHTPQQLLHLHQAERLNVSCTALNPVSNETASRLVLCASDPNLGLWLVIIGVSAGGVLLFIFMTALVCYRCRKTESNAELTPDTIYADITEGIEMKDKPASNTVNPNTIYETVQDIVETPTQKTLTVYDKIHFDRMQPAYSADVSQYQQVL